MNDKAKIHPLRLAPETRRHSVKERSRRTVATTYGGSCQGYPTTPLPHSSQHHDAKQVIPFDPDGQYEVMRTSDF